VWGNQQITMYCTYQPGSPHPRSFKKFSRTTRGRRFLVTIISCCQSRSNQTLPIPATPLTDKRQSSQAPALGTKNPPQQKKKHQTPKPPQKKTKKDRNQTIIKEFLLLTLHKSCPLMAASFPPSFGKLKKPKGKGPTIGWWLALNVVDCRVEK